MSFSKRKGKQRDCVAKIGYWKLRPDIGREDESVSQCNGLNSYAIPCRNPPSSANPYAPTDWPDVCPVRGKTVASTTAHANGAGLRGAVACLSIRCSLFGAEDRFLLSQLSK